MEAEDAAVIDAYLRGERDTVALIERWCALAASPFRRQLGLEWDDALQEARIEVFRQLRAARFRGEARLKTYLGRIVCLTCIDAVRRVRRRPRLEGDETAAELPSSDPSPLELVLRRDTGRSLRALFDATPPECRALWEMIGQGLSYREMAARLGAAEGALRVRVHRCRQRALNAAAGNRAAGRDDNGNKDKMRPDGLP